jgi:hypothetical protein
MSRDTEITITQQGTVDALAALEKADKSAAYAKQLKARLVSYHGPGDAMLDALLGAVIPYALVNPWRACRTHLAQAGHADARDNLRLRFPNRKPLTVPICRSARIAACSPSESPQRFSVTSPRRQASR